MADEEIQKSYMEQQFDKRKTDPDAKYMGKEPIDVEIIRNYPPKEPTTLEEQRRYIKRIRERQEDMRVDSIRPYFNMVPPFYTYDEWKKKIKAEFAEKREDEKKLRKILGQDKK